ncbi:hypothetical protein C1633_30470 [Pseudomonas protegens]|nr:hypothetical protein C1633_30470 [Pseudomonas protegens]
MGRRSGQAGQGLQPGRHALDLQAAQGPGEQTLIVGASLLAKAPARPLSPASRLLQRHRNVPAYRRSQLAGEEARKTAFAGKPAPACRSAASFPPRCGVGGGNQPTTK